ncbi:MAG: SGNH/GDSL hydrolase family protein [Microthrixaceae bacterium]
MRRGTRRALLSAAAVPVVAVAVLGAEVQLARIGPDLPDDTPLDHDGHVGGAGPALRMVWLGDSTAAGVGASSARLAIPRRVAAELDRPVELTNLAVSGARVRDVVDDQLPRLDALRPDVVLVSIGANDVTHLTSRADFRRTYERMLTAIPDDALIVLLGVPDMGAPTRLAQPLRAIAGLRGRQLDEVVRTLAGDHDAEYVDIAGETGPTMRSDTARYFAADRYHPSDDGYALWAAAVLEVLEAVQVLEPPRPADKAVVDAGR